MDRLSMKRIATDDSTVQPLGAAEVHWFALEGAVPGTLSGC